MDDLDYLKPRNPLTTSHHRREVLWQITVPIVAFTVILIILAGLATALPAQKASVWADISLIFLIIPAMLGAFITMAIFAALVYLFTRLLQILPFQFFRAQNGFFRLHLQISRMTDQIVEPVLKIHSYNVAARTFARQVRRRPAQHHQERNHER